MEPPGRFELPAGRLQGGCSARLSYGGAPTLSRFSRRTRPGQALEYPHYPENAPPPAPQWPVAIQVPKATTPVKIA